MKNIQGSNAPDAAPADEHGKWHSIDWKAVTLFVGKAQSRIAQATNDKDFRRAVRLPTRSSQVLAGQGIGGQESDDKPRKADGWHRS